MTGSQQNTTSWRSAPLLAADRAWAQAFASRPVQRVAIPVQCSKLQAAQASARRAGPGEVHASALGQTLQKSAVAYVVCNHFARQWRAQSCYADCAVKVTE